MLTEGASTILPIAEEEEPPEEVEEKLDSESKTLDYDLLSRSQLVSFIDKLDHRPAHMKGRIGEAQNPGPGSEAHDPL